MMKDVLQDLRLISSFGILEIMTVEVSGPPSKVNQTHYIEDRNKTCKNLKAMSKYIVSQMEVPSITMIRKLKLFGLQFYEDEVYVYSLTIPSNDFYVFSNDFKFPCLGQHSIFNIAC